MNSRMNQIDARPPPAAVLDFSPGLAPDTAGARNRMVDTQIRPTQVSDPRILKAMRELPRERFVPAAAALLAYADRAVKLGDGRVLMEPRIIARMIQVAVPKAGERALVVGAGTGYAASLLTALGLRVTALEEDTGLAETGRQVCGALAPGVRYVVGPLIAGWPSEAPYDLILIDGAVRALPESLAGQLAPTGRVAAVLSPEGHVGTVVLAEPSMDGLRARPQFDAATPLIPQLLPALHFQF